MAEEKINVVFTIQAGKREQFMQWLQTVSDMQTKLAGGNDIVIGMRAGDDVERRAALISFVDAMEQKLRKNDHKTGWRLQPVEALFRLMMLEIEEFKVAHEFFSIKDSRVELVDVANFCLIMWDRLGMLDQEVSYAITQNLVKEADEQ